MPATATLPEMEQVALDAAELRYGDERFTIVPRNPGFTVWDHQHNTERGLYMTEQGAEGRIAELTGTFMASRAVGKRRRDRNYKRRLRSDSRETIG